MSHAYAHLVEFGEPIEIGGLKIAPGDLMHGDCQGVQTIPLGIANEIPREAEKIVCWENELKEFCRSPEFSLDGLTKKLKRANAECL